MDVKNLPQGTNELYSHLGVSSGVDSGVSSDEPVKNNDIDNDAAPVTLPVSNDKIANPIFNPDKIPTSIDEALSEVEPSTRDLVEKEKAKQVSNIFSGKIFGFIKKSLPYIGVFAVGIVAFFILFTNTSINNLFSTATKTVTNTTQTQSGANVAVVPANQLSAYNSWIRSYFFDVTDPKILDPNYDYSGNGLTNYQKFLLGLNPVRQDTAEIGMSDSAALIAGIDPLTGEKMSDQRTQLIAANIDLEALSNKLALNTLDSTPQVLGANTIAANAYVTSGSQATNTASVNSYVSNNSQIDNRTSSTTPVNTKYAAQLDIPKLNISVPLIWTSDPKNLETDLQSGVVHYPGTALPGEIGTAYISGHSSNYVWAKGKYNNIFSKLGDLKVDQSFTITATDTQGKKDIYHYTVTDTHVFSATDQQQFASINQSVVALSTCWPIGTSSKRLVVFGQLTQIDQGK
jgi:LPXTG-site transpeptidase (sortase) family protein